MQTLAYRFDQSTGELRVNSGGELRIAGDTTLVRGRPPSTAAGSSTPSRGSTSSTTARRCWYSGDSHAVDDGVHLKATGGGDITAGSFIDVGNRIGSLTVTGAGSTLTPAGSISDWGAGSAGNRDRHDR